MFWLISYPGVQLLILMWVLQLVFTAFATLRSKMHDLTKGLVIILLFVSCYYTVDISKNWLGTPSFTDDEVIGVLDGYDQFTAEGKQMIAVMVTSKTGPFMFAIPYDPKTEKDLSQSMQRKSTTGKPTMVRKRSKKQLEVAKGEAGEQEDQNGQGNTPGGGRHGGGGGRSDSPMEFYDFTDQLLVPKNAPQEK